MARTLEEMIQAVDQIRRYAGAYDKPKRREFFQDLFQVLSVPLPLDDTRLATVETMYLFAVAALTAEVQPANADNYDQVVHRLNSILREGKLGDIWISTEADQGESKLDSEADRRFVTPVTRAPRGLSLRSSLPPKRRLSKVNQSLIDRFRQELPESVRPFSPKEQQGDQGQEV